MSETVSNLLAKLVLDPWRKLTPFRPDIASANRHLFVAGDDAEVIRSTLSPWLQKYQSCLFGRLAARLDLISYCILTERDLHQSDEAIRDKIQSARTQWTREGYLGRKSALVILAVSPTLAFAVPDQNLKALAQRLCSLYLLREIAPDTIYHDEIWLEKPGEQRMTWQWLAGVNYFCTNGDGRWWQDHCIPGGLAFSINSVGHLAKSSALALASNELDGNPGGVGETAAVTKVGSLNKALEFAMRTVALASNAVSGKATELMPLSSDELSPATCPIELPAFLADKDYHYYKGYYHTDFTIPSEYFLSDVKRPSHCKARTLEFTYLLNTVDNPDYITMGAGRRVRGESQKVARFIPTSQPIDANERIKNALGSN